METFPSSSADAYKALARTWAATVTIVTARRSPSAAPAAGGELDGFTATAFVTVSIHPPIIAVSVTNGSSGLAMLRDSVGFAVNLLGPTQAELAAAFAKPAVERAGLWERIGWVADVDGVPLLEGVTGAFSARVRQIVDAGDHSLVLGDVTAIRVGKESDTLVYHNRAYGRVTAVG